MDLCRKWKCKLFLCHHIGVDFGVEFLGDGCVVRGTARRVGSGTTGDERERSAANMIVKLGIIIGLMITLQRRRDREHILLVVEPFPTLVNIQPILNRPQSPFTLEERNETTCCPKPSMCMLLVSAAEEIF